MRPVICLVNVEPPEIRIAEIQGGVLHDLDIERDGRLLGDIYKGRVENILPGMDAAFVDIGTGRNALIYVGDILDDSDGADGGAPRPIEKVLAIGDDLIVQVTRPPVGSKGARVSARLSLPGRYTVLTVQADSVGVSRRIESTEERERLRRITEKLRPLDHGVIVRTEAENVSESDLARDIAFLWQSLQRIKEKASTVRAPALLHRDLGLLGRLARDRLNDAMSEIVIDAAEEYEAFRELVQLLAPQYLNRIKLYNGPPSLFEYYKITDDIAQVGESIVTLPHGGYLVIDEAEALTAIDVNTGKYTGKNRLADTVLKTNLEAAEEIARQLRLRNIGGVIVIDFIDMERTRDRVRVMDTLEAALKQDRTRTRIVELSPLGLVEMTRRREGDSLRRLLHRSCPYCSGDGVVKTSATVAIETRRRLRELAQSSAAEAFQVTLHPETAIALIGGDGEDVRLLETSISRQIWVKVDFGLHLEAARIELGSAMAFVPPDAASGGELSAGARLHLDADAPLYPQQQPQFTVVHGKLVQLESNLAPEAALTERPAVIEVMNSQRWFVAARVIALHVSAPGSPKHTA
jgi:ribonuclease G